MIGGREGEIGTLDGTIEQVMLIDPIRPIEYSKHLFFILVFIFY